MCVQSIVDRDGRVWTGELREHCGDGVVGVDAHGRRYVGRKITLGRDVDNGSSISDPLVRAAVIHYGR